MAAILGSVRKPKSGGGSITNLRVEDRGRQYRVCCQRDRVLMVMRKNKHIETALDIDGRRFRELVRLAERQYGVTLRMGVQRKAPWT